MGRLISADIPQWLVFAACAHLSLGLFSWALYAQGTTDFMWYFFRNIGPAYLFLFSWAEWALAHRVRGAYGPDEAMRTAWTMMTFGAAFRCVGVFLAHVAGVSEGVRSFGLFISGPLQMCFAVVGLRIVLRVYRGLGYTYRLKLSDWVLIAVCAVLAIVGVTLNVISPSPGFLTDIMLCVLLIQSILLRRSVAQMEGGLVAACWTSYIVAVVLTALGDGGIALNAYKLVPEAIMPITWFIWYPAAAAYALAPAFLAEAVAVATNFEPYEYSAAAQVD